MTLTGTHIHYYFICKTKLWYYHHRISMEPLSEEVMLGRVIESTYYSNVSKNIIKTEEIVVDIINIGRERILREIKKSSSCIKSAEFQLLYYMYKLKEKGLMINKGLLLIPREKKKIEVYLTNQSEKQLLEIIGKIKEICTLQDPPLPEKKAICRKCAFRDLCWA